MGEGGTTGPGASRGALTALFFLSGVPALLYQQVWQRALFTLFGSNAESVSVVVAAFLLGLGLGSLLGGRLSTTRVRPLVAFGVAELSVAAYGVVSLAVFRAVGASFHDLSPAATGAVAFALVLVPTIAMGATLPLLTAHLLRRDPSVGRSVGTLYAANTAGSAFACFAAGLFLFRALGMQGVVLCAATLNVLVGCGALLEAARERRAGGAAPAGAAPAPAASTAPDAVPRPRFAAALLVATLSGFTALGFEILWFRVYSFAAEGRAVVFPTLLGFVLLGIAGGAFVARRAGRTPPGPAQWALLVKLAAGGTLAAFLSIPLVARLSTVVFWPFTLPIVTAVSALVGAVFPVACHVGIPAGPRAGALTGRLYLGNVLGSTVGGLATGLVLLDAWPLRLVAVAIAAAGVVLALVAAAVAGRRALRPASVALVLAAAGTLAAAGPLFEGLYERLLYGRGYAGQRLLEVVESRGGVAVVTREGTIFGGGAYDGVYSTDLVHDVNGVFRAYAIPCLHPSPKRVLVVGLSSGSWARIVASMPGVESVTVVEISKGYLTLLPRHPEVASLLTDPRVTIEVDDGRRWLRRNEGARFDVVLQNTTQHWRGEATNLLSREYLELVRAHLAPGGLVWFNTTWSESAQRTAATVFPHAVRLHSFVGASDAPIVPDPLRWRDTLLAWRIDGKPVLDVGSPEHAARLEALLRAVANPAAGHGPDAPLGLETRDALLSRTRGARVVTDDNMGDEWLWPR